MDFNLEPLDTDNYTEWQRIFEDLASQRRMLEQKFAGEELAERTMKPPLRKIANCNQKIIIDFSCYDIEATAVEESLPLVEQGASDE